MPRVLHNRYKNPSWFQTFAVVPTRLWRMNSVPKRWYIEFRGRKITQKKAYNIRTLGTHSVKVGRLKCGAEEWPMEMEVDRNRTAYNPLNMPNQPGYFWNNSFKKKTPLWSVVYLEALIFLGSVKSFSAFCRTRSYVKRCWKKTCLKLTTTLGFRNSGWETL
jgi:hypothetical protein